MSDCPEDLEFKLQHMVIALKDIITEWFDLGLQLGLPDSTLRQVGSHQNIDDHLRMMLSKWKEYDTQASWEKLANALNTMGKNVIAANIRSKFVRAVDQTITRDFHTSDHLCSDQEEEAKARQEMTQTVIRKIKRQFASLQVEVRSAMEAQQVKVKDVHQFLVSFFQSECCIPEASDLTKLFNIITEAKLWRYDHYGPLKELAETFLPDGNPVRKLVSEYKDQLSGFYTTTKIINFIKLYELDNSEDDTQEFSPERYNMYYRKLTVKLKLGWTIKLSDMTMSYVDILWKALIEEFNLPPLTSIIKKIVGGSLVIEWLVPSQVSTVIATSYCKALRFYQQHNINEVLLDDYTLYDEDWIVGSTMLYQASFMGNNDEVKELLEDGANVNEVNGNEYGETAVLGACRGGHAETARILVEYSANVDYQNKLGRSALWYASSSGKTDCAKILLEYGAQVDLPTDDGDGNIALIKACRNGHVETARVLLDHKANIDYQNNEGRTPLSLACYTGKSETVIFLLKAGAKTDIQEEGGATALYWAAFKGFFNIVQMLVDYGAAVDLGRNKRGYTGLMRASQRGYTHTVRVLLEAKADPNITDEDGQTALHRAAYFKHVEVVDMLVTYGAAVDIRDEDGETALCRAAWSGHVEVVKVLVKYGAAVDIRNKEGLTALDVARGGGYQAVCEVLEEYTKQKTMDELTEGQRETIYQRLLNMLERIFLKEQVKKKEKQQKEHHHQRNERFRREK